MWKGYFKKLAAVTLIAAVTLTAAGCGKPFESASAGTDPTSSGSAKVEVLNLPGGDNGYPSPFTHSSRGPGFSKMWLVFDSLLERGEKGPISWLAEKWEISSDGKEYIFTLRDNVQWQDGQPLTAEDVKFSFEYFAKYPPVANETLIDGKSFIEKIEVLNPKTVKITVEFPLAVALGKIGATRIIPEHIWKEVTEPQKNMTKEALIGSGPYVLKEYDKEQGMYKFEAFQEYWGPQPSAEVIRFLPISASGNSAAANNIVLAFEQGGLDIAEITPDILAKYQDKPDYKVLENPSFFGYRLLLNMERRSELKDLQIRQALAYAIDEQELAEKVFRGAAVPASAGYLSAEHIWYNPEVKNYEFDLEKSKQLLAGKTLRFKLLLGNSNEEIRIAELMKISLAKAGIELEIKSVDTKTRDAAVKKDDYELVLNSGGGLGNDADVLRTVYTREASAPGSVTGIPGYSNPELERLAEAQLYEMDQQKRKEIVLKLQELIAQEIPLLPLINTTGYVVYKPAKYEGWKYMFDHHNVTHSKISFVDVK
ncbi:ABC transporter substrate-binding protein [Desulfosporosinus shakirovi]|uniref:ABC transporter substrate-binding protein n=1 Tax=Desulfosporosinus shakirovi TaxID=2885154 RepID=UPI001E2D89C8|nr:ABC transporter substrate-binding protein [Desulfosporosinus sp. SRJS8]MCB8817051.1 ABC transporter substrate-binding protein [Desulfosporosinus sp. SRJS8]